MRKCLFIKVLKFSPLSIRWKICHHTQTVWKNPLQNFEHLIIPLHLPTEEHWLLASSTLVYTFIILPAFLRGDTNQYCKPWNKNLWKENSKPCHHNNVCCYTRITGTRNHHVQSRQRTLIVVCIPAHLQSSICQTAILLWCMKVMPFKMKWWVICWN